MKRLLLGLLLVPAFAFAENAGDIRYTWFGIGHSMATIEVPGDDLDAGGWNFNVAFTVREHIHLFGEYQTLALDDFDDVSAKEKTFGIGTHFDLAERVSVFGRVGFLDISADDGFGTTLEDDGFRAIAGVRGMAWDGVELRGGVDYVDLDVSGDETAGFVGADLWITDAIALVGDAQFREDGNLYLIGARLYFGD